MKLHQPQSYLGPQLLHWSQRARNIVRSIPVTLHTHNRFPSTCQVKHKLVCFAQQPRPSTTRPQLLSRPHPRAFCSTHPLRQLHALTSPSPW